MPASGKNVSISEILTGGIAAAMGQARLLLGATFVATALWCASMFGLFVPFGTFLIGLIVHAPLQAGLMFVGVRATRTTLRSESPPSIDDVFVGFKRFPVVVILASLRLAAFGVVSLANVLATRAMEAGLPEAWRGFSSGAEILVGLLGLTLMGVSWVLLMYVSVRCIFAELIAVDPRLNRPGAWDAIKASWHVTRPAFWALLGASVLVILLMAGSAVLLCVGLIVIGIPLAAACAGAAYNRVVGPLHPGICWHCGYDLHGLDTSPFCPECGGARELIAPAIATT